MIEVGKPQVSNVAALPVRDVMTFARRIRHDDGTSVHGLLRADGSYYVIVSNGTTRAERQISKDAAHGYFVQQQQIRAVVYAVEELKLELRAPKPALVAAPAATSPDLLLRGPSIAMPPPRR